MLEDFCRRLIPSDGWQDTKRRRRRRRRKFGRLPASLGVSPSHEELYSPSATSETCAAAAETLFVPNTSSFSPAERSSGT